MNPKLLAVAALLIAHPLFALEDRQDALPEITFAVQANGQQRLVNAAAYAFFYRTGWDCAYDDCGERADWSASPITVLLDPTTKTIKIPASTVQVPDPYIGLSFIEVVLNPNQADLFDTLNERPLRDGALVNRLAASVTGQEYHAQELAVATRKIEAKELSAVGTDPIIVPLEGREKLEGQVDMENLDSRTLQLGYLNMFRVDGQEVAGEDLPNSDWPCLFQLAQAGLPAKVYIKRDDPHWRVTPMATDLAAESLAACETLKHGQLKPTAIPNSARDAAASLKDPR